MKNIYLDWAASAPVSPEVQKMVSVFLSQDIGNPSSIHQFGQYERKIIDDSKGAIAQWLKVSPREIYFTSGATESINWVIQSFARQKNAVIISTKIEHKANLVALEIAQQNGAKIELLPVDHQGRIDSRHLDQLLDKNPRALVSLLYVNNETGNIENILQIGEMMTKKYPEARLHIDATQALGWLDCSQTKLHYHYLTGAAHKLGGLKGTGLLVMLKGYELKGLIVGGGQEFDMRGGTENVAGILSWKAIAKNYSPQELEKIEKMRKLLIDGINKIPDIQFNSDIKNSTVHILNVSFEGVDGEALMMRLDLKGFAVSTGSACTTGATSASHVLLAQGIPEQFAKGSLRISIGISTKESEIKAFVKTLVNEVSELRKVAGYEL